jgi:hypothetical protein
MDLQELASAFHLTDGSNRKAFRENLVTATGQHALSGFHIFFRHHFVEHQFSGCPAFQDAL